MLVKLPARIPLAGFHDMEMIMERGVGSGQSSTSSNTNLDPQQIIGWSREATPNDLIEVGKALFSRVGNYSQQDQKMFFDQLNKEPAIGRLLTQYTHA